MGHLREAIAELAHPDEGFTPEDLADAILAAIFSPGLPLLTPFPPLPER